MQNYNFISNYIISNIKIPHFNTFICFLMQSHQLCPLAFIPAFRWICNPPAFNRSICNAIIGLKLAYPSATDR